jgi:type II secretory pathway predicted ATPase ExeA
MERWIDGEPIEIVLPGQEPPETVWFIRQMSEDELNRYAATLQEFQRAERERGKNIMSVEHVDNETDMDRESTAGKIEKVCNVHEAGDEVTDKTEIKSLLGNLPAGRYEVLRKLIVGTASLTPFERKASSSQSEQRRK